MFQLQEILQADPMKNKKIVVTGGAGFIGSNICKELCKDNKVVAIDDLSTGSLDNISSLDENKNFKFVKGSILDEKLLRKELEKADYVLHQAAFVSVPKSIKNPVLSTRTNVLGTVEVLKACVDCGVKKIVFASSAAVYGESPILPKKEEMAPKPLSPYAVSKITGEYFCKMFKECYGLKYACLRYFNVYGPKQDPSSDYAAVIPKFIRCALECRPATIYGNGKQTRDFVYVKDVVRANIKAAQSKKSGVYNIGSGKETSVNEIHSLISKHCSIDLKPIHTEKRGGDIDKSVADSSKAKKELLFLPEYMIEEGLKETIGWYRVHKI